MQTSPCLVLGEHAGDVVVHHHHFIAKAQPLTGEHANRRRAATHPHALLGHTIDHRRLSGLQSKLRAAFDLNLCGLLVAQHMHEFQRHATLFFAAAGEVMNPTQAQHLRAVFGGGDMAHFLTPEKHRRPLGSQKPIGVNLHLEAAITEDALGHHGHHVDIARARRDDERRGFVIGVSGGSPDARHKHFIRLRRQSRQHLGSGVIVGARHQRGVLGQRCRLSLQPDHRIQSHQDTRLIGVPIASADAAL